MTNLFIKLALLLMMQGQPPETGSITTSGAACTINITCVRTTVNADSGGLAVQLSGTWTGTVTFEATVNGGNWIPWESIAVTSTATSNGISQFPAVGITSFRVRGSSTITGVVEVAIRPSPGSLGGGGGSSGGGVPVTQGTSPWVVSGAVTVTGSVTATSGTATNLKTQAEMYQGGVAVSAAAPAQVSLANTGANATPVNVGVSAISATPNANQPAATSDTIMCATDIRCLVASATAPVSTMNSSTANGGLNAAIAGVFDDSSPTTITENSFGFFRISANRNAYMTIRDAAGNERGVNVDSSNRLTTAPTLVSGSVASGAFAAGALNSAIPDPCTTGTKLYYVVNLAAASTVEIANAIASEFWHICSVNLVSQGANKVIIATDDTDGCGSLTAGLNGGTTAATGWSFPADGNGIALGNGLGTVMKSATANHYLCIAPSTTAQLSGTISYISSTQ